MFVTENAIPMQLSWFIDFCVVMHVLAREQKISMSCLGVPSRLRRHSLSSKMDLVTLTMFKLVVSGSERGGGVSGYTHLRCRAFFVFS